MNPRIQFIAIAGSIAVILFVFELIRRRKLREEYSFLWFGAGIGLLILSFWRDVLEILAQLTGVAYPPSVLLLGGIVLGFFLAVHYSISLSRLAEQNKRLAQEVALLRHQVNLVGKRAGELETSDEAEVLLANSGAYGDGPHVTPAALTLGQHTER